LLARTLPMEHFLLRLPPVRVIQVCREAVADILADTVDGVGSNYTVDDIVSSLLSECGKHGLRRAVGENTLSGGGSASSYSYSYSYSYSFRASYAASYSCLEGCGEELIAVSYSYSYSFRASYAASYSCLEGCGEELIAVVREGDQVSWGCPCPSHEQGGNGVPTDWEQR